MSVVIATLGTAVLLVGVIRPSRRFYAWAALFWSRVVLFLSGTHLTIEGRSRTANAGPHFYMANHQSALDIPILAAALDGDVRFMAKKSLFRIPVFGWVIWRYGFVPIDRKSTRVTAQALDRMLARLRTNPASFAVFPEGTRTRDGKLLPFRRGTMKIGQRSQLPIVPVSIDGSFNVFSTNRFAAYPGPVRLVFHEPIPADEVAAMSTSELHDRVLGAIARELGQPFEDSLMEPTACAAAEPQP